MRETKIVLSKELKRIFTDKKMLFSLFVLPVLLIVGMFALMNMLMEQEEAETEKHVSVVYVVNMPDTFKQFVDSSEQTVKTAEASEIDSIKEMLKNANADVLMVFSESFDADIKAGKLPNVNMYYNPSENNSMAAYSIFAAGVETYRQALQASKFGSVEAIMMFSINADGNPDDYEVVDNQKAVGKMLGQMLPYFITLLLFAGAMSLGIDTIAGEKERGTLSSLLITPVKRTKIVLGKLISLMVVSVMSALVYVIALVIAMPMMGNNGDQISELMGSMASVLSPIQIVELIVIMIAIVFLYVAVIGLVSVYAKDTKEASTYVMPAYILVIGVGMVTMFGSATEGLVPYAIPFYNCSITLKSLLTGDLTGAQFAVSAVSTFIAGGLITLFIGKLFNSEKVMFNS